MGTVLTAERVWHELHDRLLRFIRTSVGDQASAEDILQDVFLKIHMRIGALRDEERLESWVFQIVRHAIADYHRAQRPHAVLPEELVAPDDEEEPAARGLSASINGMITALPEPYREALILTEYGGLTQQQLATRSGISLSGAKSRVQRAREKLKQLLLDCCHIELDRRGGIINYQPNCACCTCGPDCAASCAGL
jgi:RNA polymerase sigma-70 factor (ECF subfamily)